jgi:hypothetical protein
MAARPNKGRVGISSWKALTPDDGGRFEPRSIRTSLATLNDPVLS